MPVLAAIHNTCIGGGVDMTCCADIRYATRDAFFSIREIDLGMTADVGTLQRLAQDYSGRISARAGLYRTQYGRRKRREEAGFVNQVFEDKEAMLREVTAIARTIAEKSPLAMRGTKEMMLFSRDHSVAEGLNYIATWNSGMMSQADLESGIQAQMRKTKAVYED